MHFAHHVARQEWTGGRVLHQVGPVLPCAGLIDANSPRAIAEAGQVARSTLHTPFASIRAKPRISSVHVG